MGELLLAIVLITSIFVNMNKNSHITELRTKLEAKECTNP